MRPTQVKAFANEELEVGAFRTSVRQFQKYNVNTQASLSLLNTTQQVTKRIHPKPSTLH